MTVMKISARLIFFFSKKKVYCKCCIICSADCIISVIYLRFQIRNYYLFVFWELTKATGTKER